MPWKTHKRGGRNGRYACKGDEDKDVGKVGGIMQGNEEGEQRKGRNISDGCVKMERKGRCKREWRKRRWKEGKDAGNTKELVKEM